MVKRKGRNVAIHQRVALDDAQVWFFLPSKIQLFLAKTGELEELMVGKAVDASPMASSEVSKYGLATDLQGTKRKKKKKVQKKVAAEEVVEESS